MAEAKTFIVTGASRGLGLAIAKFLVANSHNVVLLARSEAPLAEFCQQHEAQTRYIAADLRDFNVATEAVALAKATFGGSLHGVFFNHTLLDMKRILDTSVSEWRDLYDVNVFSAIAFIQAALADLRETKGCIIFTSSGASQKPNVGWGVYGSGKAVLDFLAATLAREEPDVTTLSIAPGTVDTDMQKEIREVHHKNLTTSDAERFLTLHKEGQLLRPEVSGNLMARLAINPPKALSGRYLRYNAQELAPFRSESD